MEDAALRGVAWMDPRTIDTERALLRRLSAGERSALDELWAAHGRALQGYLRHLSSDPELCEEVLQDTLVAAWRGAARFAGRSSLRTWLIGIARRQMLSALRRRRLPLAAEEAMSDVPAAGLDPQDAALAAAERAALAAAMRGLSPLHREILRLAFVEDLSYPELTRVLGVPLGTVKSRLSNAKRALRKLWESREAHRA